MKPIIWSPQAEADLEAVWRFYAIEADADVAHRVARRLHSRIEALANFPELGRDASHLKP